jgi:endonuclease/exonuclease/phosphatase family metal-dependent hydrolase
MITSRVRRFFFMAVLAAAVTVATEATSATVTVMTQNMDAGTDLGFVLAYLNTSTPTVGIDLTCQELPKSDFEGRATELARQIAEVKPDLISLQEVTLWSSGPDPYHLTPLFDQLALLLSALEGSGEEYVVLAVNPLTTAALPMSSGTWLGYLDRDVVLMRNRPGLTAANIRKNTFAAILTMPTPLGELKAPQGWIAADVTVSGSTFTVVETHLQSMIPGHPEVAQLQVLQAQELASTDFGTNPVVIAGDFNSNATHTPPERTPSVAVMESAGYIDTWRAANRGNPGFTWPLYLEDPFRQHPNGPFERIDFIFQRGLGIQTVDRIGWKAPHASDHAGVVATLSF